MSPVSLTSQYFVAIIYSTFLLKFVFQVTWYMYYISLLFEPFLLHLFHLSPIT